MNKQKKIMLLGGIHYLLPAIKTAHAHGYYVITADYLPDNVAHKYSDEYVNVSIVDKEAVLKVAQEKQIDGIISFGVDPGVVAAAYVQEKMGLPSMGPYASVEILQNKDKFRAFLQEHGFNCPKSKGYSSIEEALADTDWLTWPMIVKPTDSAGSKGVTRVDRIEDYKAAVEEAFVKSIKGNIVVEQFIEQDGYQSGSDSFSVDGKMVFTTFDDQHFDKSATNPYTPSAHTWPSTMPREAQDYLRCEIQRLVSLLGMKTTMYNIEARVGKDGKPYIMELSPRAGGNCLAELLVHATDVDMITAQVCAAVGDDFQIEDKPFKGYWADIILHAPKSGRFEGIEIVDSYKKNVVEVRLWKKVGDKVDGFDNASNSIGVLFARFDDREEIDNAIANQDKWIKIEVE